MKFQKYMMIPDESMVLIQHDDDDLYYDDFGQYGGFPMLAVVDDGQTLIYSYDVDGIPGFITEDVKVIPKRICPKCGNTMTVKPFRRGATPKYYCPVCGWKLHEVKPDDIIHVTVSGEHKDAPALLDSDGNIIAEFVDLESFEKFMDNLIAVTDGMGDEIEWERWKRSMQTDDNTDEED